MLSPAPTLRTTEPLEGRLVRLEPLAENHRARLRELGADAMLFRFMAWPDTFDRWFDEALDGPDEVPFAVCKGSDPIGSTRFLNIAPEHRRTEIGWTWLPRTRWGTGANIEAKLLLLEHAFERCGMQRVEFKTDVRNERAKGSLLALGARFERVARKHMMLPSGTRDSAWLAITDADWPSVKARLEARLERRLSAPT